MKKLLYFFICLAVAACCNLTAYALEPDPKEAAANIIESIKGIDLQSASFADNENKYLSIIQQNVFPAMLSKIEYAIGNAKVSGRSAMVDIKITSADIDGICADILAKTAKALFLKNILSLSVDIDGFLINQINNSLSAEQLKTISTNTTVYLVPGGDGQWKLDLSDKRNLLFFNALLGSPDIPEPVAKAVAALIA